MLTQQMISNKRPVWNALWLADTSPASDFCLKNRCTFIHSQTNLSLIEIFRYLLRLDYDLATDILFYFKYNI
jgi:hypothetical protein